jgi:hypothetical protein
MAGANQVSSKCPVLVYEFFVWNQKYFLVVHFCLVVCNPSRLNQELHTLRLVTSSVLAADCISVESANMPVASSRSEGHRSDLEDDDALGLEPIWYHLYAVVVHHGKLDSGHYTSFFR